MPGKVLVVDDERIVCRAMQKMLELRGYEVCVAKSGEDAVEKAVNEKIGLAFIDFILPGIDGVEVCKELKKINPNIKTVIMSGHISILKEKKADFDNLQGCIEIMEKPFGGDDVLKIADDFFVTGQGC